MLWEGTAQPTAQPWVPLMGPLFVPFPSQVHLQLSFPYWDIPGSCVPLHKANMSLWEGCGWGKQG